MAINSRIDKWWPVRTVECLSVVKWWDYYTQHCRLTNVTAKAARQWKSIYVNVQNKKLVGEVRAKVTSEVMMQTVQGRGWRLPTGALGTPAE